MSATALVHKGTECFLIKSNKIQAEGSWALSGVYFLGWTSLILEMLIKHSLLFPL